MKPSELVCTSMVQMYIQMVLFLVEGQRLKMQSINVLGVFSLKLQAMDVSSHMALNRCTSSRQNREVPVGRFKTKTCFGSHNL